MLSLKKLCVLILLLIGTVIVKIYSQPKLLHDKTFEKKNRKNLIVLLSHLISYSIFPNVSHVFGAIGITLPTTQGLRLFIGVKIPNKVCKKISKNAQRKATNATKNM